MTLEEQFNAMRTWLIHEAGLPEVILAHDGAMSPNETYASLNMLGAARIGRGLERRLVLDENGEDNSEEYPADEVVTEEWAYQWSLNIYGQGAAFIARRVKSLSETNAALDRALPITPCNFSDIRRIPERVNETWQDRAQMDFEIRVFETIAPVVGVIETTNITFTQT